MGDLIAKSARDMIAMTGGKRDEKVFLIGYTHCHGGWLSGGEGDLTFDQFLQAACGGLDLEWRKYRRRSARHRLDSRLRVLRLKDYRVCLELLQADPAEAAGLADLLRVTVSRFFREQECWFALANKVLPVLFAEAPSATLRAWSAGCCGGEEPYTLALIWLEYLQPLYPGCSMEIVATDIDRASLARARHGEYGAGSLREVPAALLARWFARTGEVWWLDEKVKEPVRFETRNLMTDPPPEGMDLVLCRYLAFTYYRGERCLAAARRLWEALRPGGALMIGRKESLPAAALEFFEPWPGCAGFFRRKG